MTVLEMGVLGGQNRHLFGGWDRRSSKKTKGTNSTVLKGFLDLEHLCGRGIKPFDAGCNRLSENGTISTISSGVGLNGLEETRENSGIPSKSRDAISFSVSR